MRPVNLIPADDRRRDPAATKSGALPYILIGVLALAVLAVTAVTLLGKNVSDKEAEVVALEAAEAESSARAESLAPFVKFEQISSTRADTVTALARSRFDWERVIRELSRVIPNKVWLTSLIGTVSPGVSVSDGESVNLRAEVEGPALELVGCAKSQREVAALISALGDIDGVTRVTAGRSEKPIDGASDSTSARGSVGDDCRTRDFITRFEAVAAFDAVAVPAGAAPAPVVPAPTDDEQPAAAVEGGSGDGGSSSNGTDGSASAQPASSNSQGEG